MACRPLHACIVCSAVPCIVCGPVIARYEPIYEVIPAHVDWQGESLLRDEEFYLQALPPHGPRCVGPHRVLIEAAALSIGLRFAPQCGVPCDGRGGAGEGRVGGVGGMLSGSGAGRTAGRKTGGLAHILCA